MRRTDGEVLLLGALPVVGLIWLSAFLLSPGFVQPLSRNVAAALAAARDDDGDGEPALLYSAHSIPTAMAQASDYEAQLREVARLVTERCAPGHPWSLVWQSRSGPPAVPWLEPDVGDALTELAAGGTRSVVVAPIGFISDHMEVVYDLDVLAADRAAALGLRFARAATVGTAPEFVAMIRELVEERLDPAPSRSKGRSGPAPSRSEGRSLGGLGVRPDCAAGCCPAR